MKVFKKFVKGSKGVSEVLQVVVLLAIALTIGAKLLTSGENATGKVGGDLMGFVGGGGTGGTGTK